MKKSKLQNTAIVALVAMLCCALWGSAFPCIKSGYRLFGIAGNDSATQILFAGMRFTLAGILVILIGSLMYKQPLLPNKKNAGKIIHLSLYQTILQYVFFYVGLAHTTGVKASIIVGTNVFLAILISSLFFKMEKLNLYKIVGCILGFSGVILINAKGGFSLLAMNPLGDTLIFLCTVSSALSSVYIKHFGSEENPVLLSGWQFGFGGVVMMLVGLVAGGRVSMHTAPQAILLLYLSLISAVAYTLWALLLQHNPVSKVAVFGFLNPIFGVLLSIAFLPGENSNFGFLGVLSLICIAAGIAIVNGKKAKKMSASIDSAEK